jgi:hypothetical protein
MIAIASYLLLFAFSGLIMYAFYFDCSPLLTGKVKTSDQVWDLSPVNPALVSRELQGLMQPG